MKEELEKPIRYEARSELEKQERTPTKEDLEIYETVRTIIEIARKQAKRVVNKEMVHAYWQVGLEVTEAVGDRARYGKYLLQFLSKRLTADFGKGFTVANLRNMRQFYRVFPNQSELNNELSWTHYRTLMRIDDSKRREFYLIESVKLGWTTDQLERQVNSFYYERLLITQKELRQELSDEVNDSDMIQSEDYIFKDPYILEFMDLKGNVKYTETELEEALIDKLQEFLLELGKGFSFVARQKRITTEHGEHYYIDVVFYNYILKCFVIVDLKTDKLTYQDVGQIDFYVRLFDEKIKQIDDNPTIGLVLVTDKDESIVKYSVLSDNDKLFASRYKLYLPTEEELRIELERERKYIESQIRDE